LNWPGPPWEADWGGVKRTERGEPTGAVTHICTGTTQGNSLRSYLYLKLAKCQVSHFIFYVFSSIKLENRGRNRIGAVGTVGREEVVGKGVGG
jgi:hypothetical protein